MTSQLILIGFLLCATEVASAQDPVCPAYPLASRTEFASQVKLDRDAQQWRKIHRGVSLAEPTSRTALKRNNFIDQILLAEMEVDSVQPADLASDSEFLRRVSLDVTGRIPQTSVATSFLADISQDKRSRLIESLLGSEDYVDQWTFYLMDRFQVTSGLGIVGRPGNRVFYKFVRDCVKRNCSWQDFAHRTITAAGDNGSMPIQFLVRQWAGGDSVIQDTWDAMADAVTTQFLGVTTQCISCHDGRGYLTKVNVYLSKRVRPDFWRLSAFFARTSLNFISTNAPALGVSQTSYLIDLDTGRYNGFVSAAMPGIRPPRKAASYDPAYLFNGEQPQTDNWREEFARLVTSDRQFARAAVNYIWAAMFGYGIVDPPNAWDLARTDPQIDLPAGWPSQNSQPELLEALTDSFVSSGYSMQSLIRLIANSTVYQLSSEYKGDWQPAFTRYFAKRVPRRLTAEQIYDSVVRATQTEVPLYIDDLDGIVYYANQLPDVVEPRFDTRVSNFLGLLGRGVWYGSPPRATRPSLLGALFMLNSYEVMSRSFAAPTDGNVALNRSARLAAQPISDQEVVRQLFLAALVRNPSDQEMQIALAAKSSNRAVWIANLQWALLNKLEFLFN